MILFEAHFNDYVNIKVLRDLLNSLCLIEINSDYNKVHAQERVFF